MNYRRLGSAGLKISELSLGSWVTYGGQVGEEVALKCMSAAHDAGFNFFDNAEAYAQGNAEVAMGNVIKKMGWRRESGASGPEQVAENMKAVEVAPKLTTEVIERIEQVPRNKPQQDED